MISRPALLLDELSRSVYSVCGRTICSGWIASPRFRFLKLAARAGPAACWPGF
ncbi:hypothetical protein K523DRAFT_359221 [Schizophyllum commune Tattone D]|nr:hypothetical protein K523DRAFT_359221 [Schizophyllum commune Tattone D]